MHDSPDQVDTSTCSLPSPSPSPSDLSIPTSNDIRLDTNESHVCGRRAGHSSSKVRIRVRGGVRGGLPMGQPRPAQLIKTALYVYIHVHTVIMYLQDNMPEEENVIKSGFINFYFFFFPWLHNSPEPNTPISAGKKRRKRKERRRRKNKNVHFKRANQRWKERKKERRKMPKNVKL
ncbi:hypothetical protein K504DRAFT_164446 [Pleomassaria siparia CBS 279.74]|uniref:Uncharacterized protein n=1 Tax=Pleomassaria siparia CBS 279.74 TaxID=1314801 RepID=A0A6G1JVV6_9PLEO|nr:hypothetical protein K504DRAFT_164446 [Pleomassaria siparia CBS 279.74]